METKVEVGYQGLTLLLVGVSLRDKLLKHTLIKLYGSTFDIFSLDDTDLVVIMLRCQTIAISLIGHISQSQRFSALCPSLWDMHCRSVSIGRGKSVLCNINKCVISSKLSIDVMK